MGGNMPERLLYSFLEAYDGGINSDVAPILLPRNVASWGINITLRGGFARPRPPLFVRILTFPSAEVQDAVETGFFQGAGYYRPDFGASQLVAQIGGRLFTFTEAQDLTWTVAEITIPGDPNSPTTNQVWMNQAEKWLIITDGTSSLPIFYDGATARRSAGPSVVIGVVNATSTPNPPTIGQTLQVTLNAPYTGQFNIPILFNGEYYQTIASSTATPEYAVRLRAFVPAVYTLPIGAQVTVDGSLAGFVWNSTQLSPTLFQFGLEVGSNNIVLGQTLIIGGGAYQVSTVPVEDSSGSASDVRGLSFEANKLAGPVGNPGNVLAYYGAPAPSYNVTTLAANVFTTGVPDEVIITATTSAFSGMTGQTVSIFDTGGNQRVFTIENAPPPPPSTTLTLVNLTDAGPGPYVLPADILSVPEIPASRMGAYGLGHQAQCLIDGQSFIYGDTVGGPSGTQAYNYRDSVLRTTENTFLVGGGAFRIPNSGEIITSMTFTAILDAAYGQGPLEIGTPISIFTCAVPTNQAAWIALENPILTQALIGQGPLAQNSTILANSDTLFRSVEGLGSLIFGRRDFETWGNTPISVEMNRTTQRDIRSLLNYSSAITFDNRLLCTAAPQVSNQGVFHIGTLALNFDPVSSLRGKAPSIWESLWTGTNVLQYLSGTFNSAPRAFQFTFNQNTSKIQLVEQLRSDSNQYFDNGTDRIEWVVETPCIFKPEEREPSMPIVRLRNGKMQLAEIVGTVRIRVLWRPDFYPCWSLWFQRDVCAAVDAANSDSHPGYATEIGFGEPPVLYCSAANDRPLRNGRFHQIRIELVGQAVIMGMEFAAVPEPEVIFPSPLCNIQET